MEGKNILSYYLYVILLICIYKVYGKADCSKITMLSADAKECISNCEAGNNNNECIQWRCNNFKEMLIGFNFNDIQLDNLRNIILSSPNCNIQNNGFFNYNIEGDITKINLANKISSGVINENICALTNLEELNIPNNNLKGNNTVYGQLPSCINKLSNLQILDISNNRFRGRIPYIGPQIQTCRILKNNLCLFHEDKIPKVCLDNPSEGELKINETEYRRGDNLYFTLCENIFVDKNQNVTSRIFNNRNNTNVTLRILIYSSIFPLCSLIITTVVTIYGRIKSKFNKKDPNITTFSASISHLPNNFGNISNNNRHSLLTKYDSYNRPAPRPDNENTLFNNNYDQKRISNNPSNPSTSLANTSVSSNTPSSPVISPNEIKNSNYRVIGSHYSMSMNPNQAIRFKNSLSTIQNNRNSLTSGADTNSIPASNIATTVQNTFNNKASATNDDAKSTPAVSQSESQNEIISPTLENSNNINNGNPTSPSKAKESLDLLLSSPQAMYFQSNRTDRRREMLYNTPINNRQSNQKKALSPILSKNPYPSMPEKQSSNIYGKSQAINNNNNNNNNIDYDYSSTKIPLSPTMSVPQFKSIQSIIPSALKLNPQLSNRHSPNSIKRPRIRRVIYSFTADLPDELELTPGDEVVIHKVFDDGYACGENITTGKYGVFPITSFHADDQDISPEEFESSPNINDLQFSQLSLGNMKSSGMMNSIINKPQSPTTFNNIRNQDVKPILMINKENISNNLPSELYSNSVNMNNLYPLNISQNSNSQNSNSQNSNSQNSLTDEDDIDTLRRQSKIGYSAFMDQQKQKLMRKQAKQLARKNKLNTLNENGYYRNEQKPLSPTYISQNILLNENINNKMFGESQNLQSSQYTQPSQQSQLSQYSQRSPHLQHSQLSQYTQPSQHSLNDIANSSFNSSFSSSLGSPYKNILNDSIRSESPSSQEMQRMEDRRNRQIRLLNERLSKKDIGPEEKRYNLQLHKQLKN